MQLRVLAFVLAGAKVAPKEHFIVALILTVLHAIAAAIIVTAELMSGRNHVPSWVLIGAGAIGVTATIFVCVMLYRDDKRAAMRLRALDEG